MIGKEERVSAAEIFPELTRDVIARMNLAQSARLRDVMEIVVRHLHAIVREAKVTQGEWAQAIDFLTRAGQMCSESRQELILLSDILGVSMLVDAVDNVAGPGVTDSTVLGPFYAGEQRELAQGDSILLREEEGVPLVMSGRVTGPEGQPVANALIEAGRPRPISSMTSRTKTSPRGICGRAFAPMRQGSIDSRPSCRSAIRFPTTVRPVNCWRPWDGIRFAPRTSIS
jgi:hypothetical protein